MNPLFEIKQLEANLDDPDIIFRIGYQLVWSDETRRSGAHLVFIREIEEWLEETMGKSAEWSGVEGRWTIFNPIGTWCVFGFRLNSDAALFKLRYA